MGNSRERAYDDNDFERDIAQIEAELALGLLARFIAVRTRLVAAEQERREPDAALITVWQSQLKEAARHHRTLDTRNRALVREVEGKFRALLD
jgi:hypothetical protein